MCHASSVIVRPKVSEFQCASPAWHCYFTFWCATPVLSIPALRATSSITSVPNVTCRLNLLWSTLLYSVAQVYQFCYNHQVPLTTRCVSVVVSHSKCLLYIDYLFRGKVSWFFMLYQVSQHWCKRKKVGQ